MNIFSYVDLFFIKKPIVYISGLIYYEWEMLHAGGAMYDHGVF